MYFIHTSANFAPTAFMMKHESPLPPPPTPKKKKKTRNLSGVQAASPIKTCCMASLYGFTALTHWVLHEHEGIVKEPILLHPRIMDGQKHLNHLTIFFT